MTSTPRRRGVSRATLLVTLALVATAWAAVSAPGPVGAQQRRVVVVGDSVILGAQGPITSSFNGAGWAVTFDAAVSRSTAAGLQAVESHRAELTDSLVVSLGANDAGSPGAFRQRVQAILDATAGVPHVYWVTIREVRDYYGPANQIVRDLAAGRPNVTVIDWHAATAGATDLTASDGLHLNGSGAARMASVVTDAVVAGALPAAAAPAPPPPAPTTAAPTTAPPPTTAAPTTTVPTTSTTAATTTTRPSTTTTIRPRRAAFEAEEAADELAGDPLIDSGTVRTVGGAFGIVVAALALGGLALAGWSVVKSSGAGSDAQES